MKKKILKIKVGEAFIDGKNINVYSTAWEQKAKDGSQYFEIKTPIFLQEIEIKETKKAEKPKL